MDGEFRELLGRRGYHLLSWSHLPLQMRQCRAREGNDLPKVSGLLVAEGEVQPLSLPLQPAFFIWHHFSFPSLSPCLFVKSKMVFNPTGIRALAFKILLLLLIFHPQEEFHLYPCTGCPQGSAWGWLLVSTLKMPSTRGQCTLE